MAIVDYISEQQQPQCKQSTELTLPITHHISVDMTQQHQTQAQSNPQTQLVSMLAHELRSPLNVISFSTSLLKRHCDRWNEEKKRPYLDRIQTAVEQLNQLMEEVLVLGKAEAGKLTWESEEFNLEQFCRELLVQLQLSRNLQHNLIANSQGNCSKVRLDRKLLQPILTNLLDNAVKYSPVSSTVILNFCCNDGKAIFQVKDSGIGIPAVEQKRLFEPFYRCENAGNTLGSGLGLAVVKKLVDLHGGQIDLASEVGIGSTFTVILPCSK